MMEERPQRGVGGDGGSTIRGHVSGGRELEREQAKEESGVKASKHSTRIWGKCSAAECKATYQLLATFLFDVNSPVSCF